MRSSPLKTITILTTTITLIFLVIIPSLSHALPRVIRIGGLFSAAEQEQELVFHAAIEKVNANFANRTIFEAVVEHARPYNSYEAHFKTCDLLRHSPVAIIGPFNPISSLQVQSICEHLEVPHVEARLMVDFQPRTDLSIQLYPHLSTLSRAYLDIIDAWGWTAFAVIIQESDSVVHFKDFFPYAAAKGWEIRLFQLQPDRPYRDVLWQVKRLKMRNILLDVRTDHLLEVLRQAQQVGIMTERHHYLITSLDLHTLPLENYRHSQTNITSLRIVREEHPVLQSLLADWPAYAARFMPRSQGLLPPPEHLSSKSAMIFDGVQILALGLAELDQFTTPPTEALSCEDTNARPWQYGASVLNYVRQVRHEGLTGYVAFDETSGFRSKLSFELISTMDTDFEVIATWTDLGGGAEEEGNGGQNKNGLVMGSPKERAGLPKPDYWMRNQGGGGGGGGSKKASEIQNENDYVKKPKERLSKTANWNRHSPKDANLTVLRVSTKLIDPYLYEANATMELRGNARFDGYIVDLLDEVAAMLNIRYELLLVKDNVNGAPNEETGKWTGMIAEVMYDRAEMAISDLTITPLRESVVDFTYPFMATGIQILYKRPTTKVTSLWSFLSPFSTTVWIYLITAIVSISMILFYVGRFTPYQWLNPNPCPHHEPILENELKIKNSFWCTVGSLMQQGTEVAPKTLSTRIICAIWYFFTLIIVSSYTANLAAFLTVEKETWPFTDAKGLADQKEVRYGCVFSGSTRTFFEKSKIPEYQKIFKTMNAHSDCSSKPVDPNKCWFTTSNAEGEARVEREDGKYAFFMESASIEFTQERQCNLTAIGTLLDNKGYGIATKKGNPLRGKLSEAILKLQESGVLQKLKEKWWKQKGGGMCIAKPAPATTELTLKNLGGVFLVLVVGTLFAVMLVFLEFLIRKKVSSNGGGGGGSNDGSRSASFRKDLTEHLIFALSCWQSTKPVRQKSLKSLSGSRSGGLEKTPAAMANSVDGNAFPMKAYY